MTALEAAARLGPYFTWEPYDGAPGWRPLRELRDGEVIAERVEIGRRTLAAMSGGGVDERVVASIVFLGLASRLLSPPLAAAAVGNALPVPDADRLWWRPVDSGPMPIACRDLTAVACADQPAADIAGTLTRTVTQGLVEPILGAFRRRFVLSPQVLWGNVASALGGAAGMIAGSVPGRAARAAAVVDAALAVAPLSGTATLVHPDPGKNRWFLVRNNCCLYYRIPGGGTCGDCVLTPQHIREQQWRAQLERVLRSPGDYGGDD
ncbi:(2Fe-2S)-binding protein [Actinoplanes aureus]|uniref:(2Fe-2S)-binding protein n=1 Tax=Actinoplanes aureus TaxID=2792083 RepID=A0A931G076_9ACTN|nr:(2Fe-2S)-binding protein [Actinoplanes aureus]MBG0565575.1 (2Fe-2S)-binding protein [Actinoplanes aureus]